MERGTLRFALYGESLEAVPSSGQPARRVLFSLCLVAYMYWMDGMEGGGRSMDSAHPENLQLHKEQTPVGR